MGRTVSQGLNATSDLSKVTWTAVDASNFPGGASELVHAVTQQKTWVAIASWVFTLLLPPSSNDRCSLVNKGATSHLESSYTTPNASYNGSEAVTVYADEARNENA